MAEKTEKPKVKLTGDFDNDLTRGEIIMAVKELRQAGFEVEIEICEQSNEETVLFYENFRVVGLDNIRYFIKNFSLYKE